MVGSTEFLHLIAKSGGYILYEKGAPYTRLKKDFISIKSPDGQDLEISTPYGYKSSPVILPREIFDDFREASFIEQDGEEDEQHRLVFRLTHDGLERGNAATAT